MSELTGNPDMVKRVLADRQALEILDALKPGFSVRGLELRRTMASRLRDGELEASRDLLFSAGLLSRTEQGWAIPEYQRRLAYHLASLLRDHSPILESVFNAAEVLGVDPGSGPWLDIGCGAGSLLRSARQRLAVATLGTDVDEDALCVARLADDISGSVGQYSACRSHQISMGQRYTIICSIVSFQHFLVLETLERICRLVDPPGMVFLRLEGPGYYLESCRRYLRDRVFPTYAIRCLLQCLRLEWGLGQSQVTQQGWYKLEIPLRPKWVENRLSRLGVKKCFVHVHSKLWGQPIFFDLFGVMR